MCIRDRVRYGHRARFFRIVLEIALGMVVSFLTNDGNRIFVGAYGPVGTQSKKHRLDDIIAKLSLIHIFLPAISMLL